MLAIELSLSSVCAWFTQAVAAIARAFPDLPEPVGEATMTAAAEYVAGHVIDEESTWGHMHEQRCAFG